MAKVTAEAALLNLRNGEWSSFTPEIIVRGNLLVMSMVLVFIAFFALGVPRAAGINPPLPEVEIIGGENGCAQGSCRLVAHVDGVWHFFDESNTLRAIPDDKVMTVKFSKKETVKGTSE